jgi:uncharacterized ion transporter superfamily protein YfcC
MTLKLPHPLVLLMGAVALAAASTWVLPAGEFSRRENAATGRIVVVPGTYETVDAAPVGLFDLFVAVPRGFIEGADVIAVILFVGGAWVVVDRTGTLARMIASLVAVFRRRGLWAIPVFSFVFGTMGALENMQEEIIPLVPVLLVLGRGLGVNAVVVVAMSAGAAMVGSAFGPTNPFQAGIAMKLAQLPPLSMFGLRSAMFVAGLSLWSAWTMRYAARTRLAMSDADATGERAGTKDVVIMLCALAPMVAYVYGALALDWGFNELSAGFVIAGIVVGLAGGLGVTGTINAYFEGMQTLLPAAIIVGMARSISLVMADGRVIDTILNAMAAPLSHMSGASALLLMIPFHALLHIPVSSVSGQAVLTMPIMVPLADLLGLSRDAAVIAYQTGAGLMELLTPTNGALMALLLAAKVPFGQWFRFAIAAAGLMLLVGIIGVLVA